jgi:hypothetical protein
MGRKAMPHEYKKTKQRERDQKYLSNPDTLDRKRESNRLQMQETRRRERLTSIGSRAFLADMTTQAETMRCVNEEEEEEEERLRSDHDDGDDRDDGDDDDGALNRQNFDHGGFGDDDWEDQGFNDDGFESMTIMTIITDVYRSFEYRSRRTTQPAGSGWARSTNRSQFNIRSEDVFVRLIVRRREFVKQ